MQAEAILFDMISENEIQAGPSPARAARAVSSPRGRGFGPAARRGSTSARATSPSRRPGPRHSSLRRHASSNGKGSTCMAEDAENLDMDMMQTLQADRKATLSRFVPLPECIRESWGRSWNCRRGAMLRACFLLMP